MAQQVRVAPVTKPDDLGLIPGPYMVEGRELTLSSYPLTSAQAHVPMSNK